MGFAAAVLVLLSQQAEEARVFAAAAPSVVAIRNPQGHGSGMILDDRGTILTNAHVVVSPLPLTVEVAPVGSRGPVYFRRVTLLGVHPEYDMALIKIDATEHNVTLTPITMSPRKAAVEDRIYAIGFPKSHGGTRKIITPGKVLSLDRFVDLPGYFELAAAIHPGNSGGPVVDGDGRAMGVVTWGWRDPKNPAGMAIPLTDFHPERFVPLSRRPPNPGRSAENMKWAEEGMRLANQKGGMLAALIAEEFYMMALMEDPVNPQIYAKIGLISRHTDRYDVAAAYLMRALQLKPWCEEGGVPYHELGVSLRRLGKHKEALSIWKEGTHKYPTDGTLLWDALAVVHFESGNYFEAALASRASVRTFAERGEKMNSIYQESRGRLDAEALKKLRAAEEGLDAELRRLQAAAEAGRRAGKDFMTEEGGGLIRGFHGVQKEAGAFDFDSLKKPSAAPRDPAMSDDELMVHFIRTRIGVAREHLGSGRKEKAVQILEDVVKAYPDHPETEEARLYLYVIRTK